MKKQSRFKDVVEILTGLLWIVVNADKLLMKKYRSWLLNKRIKAAIQQAQENCRLTGRKHLVMMYKDKPIVVSRQRLKKLISTRKFKKGTTIKDLENKALFITKPGIGLQY